MKVSNTNLARSSRTIALAVFGFFAAGFFSTAAAQSPEDGPVTFYVGTYTKTTSKGIYQCRLDPKQGRLELLGVAAETVNPSFLALHPNGKFVYSVNEVSEFQGRKTGSVTAFSIDPTTGTLKYLDNASSEGSGPCHLSLNPSGLVLAVANYGDGAIAMIPVMEDGSLGQTSSVIRNTGSGPDKERQEGPHAHCVKFGPSSLLFASDLGLDKVFMYEVDIDGNRLIPATPSHVSVEPGAGPRHFTFHPKRGDLYVVNEMASTVSVFRSNPAGARRRTQTISTLPEGFKGENWPAEIAIAPSGRFLYASNRGHDSIAIFSVAATGLSLIGTEPTQGQEPRHFAIDPSGKYMVVANQSSDNLVLFRIDQESGKLTPAGSTLSIPMPVCVLFRPEVGK